MTGIMNEMSETIVLQNGRIIDPVNKVDGQGDLWLRDGRIVEPESSCGAGVLSAGRC